MALKARKPLQLAVGGGAAVAAGSLCLLLHLLVLLLGVLLLLLPLIQGKVPLELARKSHRLRPRHPRERGLYGGLDRLLLPPLPRVGGASACAAAEQQHADEK